MDDVADSLCRLEDGGSKAYRPAAIPNASAAIFGERKQVVCLEGSRLCRVQKKAGVVATSGRPLLLGTRWGRIM